MASFSDSIVERKKTKLDSRTNVELNGEPFKIFKFKTETISPEHQATVIYQKNIGGETLIWGNENFGIWNNYKWGNTASQSFILGLGKLGINTLGERSSELEVVRVVSVDDNFIEQFLGDAFLNMDVSTITRGNGYIDF